MPINNPDGLWVLLKQLFIGGIAAGVHYIYTVLRGVNFEWIAFFLNISIGSFVGWLTGEFIGDDVPYHDGLIAIAGISAFKLIDAVEHRSGDLVDFIIKNKK